MKGVRRDGEGTKKKRRGEERRWSGHESKVYRMRKDTQEDFMAVHVQMKDEAEMRGEI
jgi:hypothetical protein